MEMEQLLGGSGTPRYDKFVRHSRSETDKEREEKKRKGKKCISKQTWPYNIDCENDYALLTVP